MNRVVLLASLVAVSAFAQQVETKPGSVEIKSKGKTVKVTGSGVVVESTKDGKKKAVEVDAKQVKVEKAAEAPAAEGWDVSGASETLTHACTPGESVSVTGASNTLTLTGPCGTIEVSGASNTISIDEAAAIEATGAANKIFWKSGPKGGKPSISSTGMANTISQKK